MAYLSTNNFYSSISKGKGSGFVPAKPKMAMGKITPGTFTGPKPPTTKPLSADMTPAVPPRSGPAVLPPDPTYDTIYGGLVTTRDDTIAGLAAQRTQGLSDFGYTEDPTTHAIAYDPNNPYSQAALLRKHYQQTKTGNTTSLAAQGQLYAGSLQNAQNAATSDFNQGDHNLSEAVIRFLAGNTQATKTAGNTFDTNAGLAYGDRLGRAPSNPLYDNSPNMVTAGPKGQALVGQTGTSTVKLANGWSVIYDDKGNAIRFLPPGG